MTKSEAAELIDLVIARAPKLREAGVLELGLDGLSMKLAHADLEPEDPDAVEDKPVNMWTDPDTYGRGPVPGVDRSKEPKK